MPFAELFFGFLIALSVCYFCMKRTLLRLITLPSCLCWIAYNVFVGNWEAMISDTLSLGSILIAIWKFDMTPAKNKSTEEIT